MSKKDAEDLKKSFRNTRGQEQIPNKNKRLNMTSETEIESCEKGYKEFLSKYNNLNEINIMTYTAQDLVFHFREAAKENNYKYIIANKMRDLGVFKLALKRYDAFEICLMIEFMFNSEQNYIDKYLVQPTILTSTFCNRIYKDAKDWYEDKYTPSKEKYTKEETEYLTESDVTEFIIM